MANYKRKRGVNLKNRQKAKRKRNIILFAILAFTMLISGLFLKNKIAFYYAMHFNKAKHKKLSNSESENNRINRIIGENTDHIFGIDLSHYQNKEDIQWDSLSIANRSIPIQFVLMRATMGSASTDQHFEHFWQKAQHHDLIRGAYHFYRVNEDPTLQAQNFIRTSSLASGDLRPVLDIEKISKKSSKESLIRDLKIWLKMVEDHYGTKPIIYTYYHYYKDYLRQDFQDYPIWLANYNDVATPSEEDAWSFWQFSENGIVHGINTKVDLNVYNGGIWGIRALTLD